MNVLGIFKKYRETGQMTEEEKRKAFPCLFPQLVPFDKVVFNDYNPNAVAPPEMRLLAHSLEEDGYTQPIVTVYDSAGDRYVVVDGAHRYKNAGAFGLPYVPVVVIDREMKDRMAATIRHNRARGEHNVTQMSGIVAGLIRMGWSDPEIGKHLGMQPDEVLRLKQNTGLAEIFREHEYSRAWE
jgi:ParB-like chromosome segregation protein Spo0J